jgi:hypothetical protein
VGAVGALGNWAEEPCAGKQGESLRLGIDGEIGQNCCSLGAAMSNHPSTPAPAPGMSPRCLVVSEFRPAHLGLLFGGC